MQAAKKSRSTLCATLAILAGAPMTSFGQTGPAGDFTIETRDQVALRAAPFPLSDVRLLDGPFKRAQDLDRQYLLQIDVDRLLRTFRLNAGLSPTAAAYGGWEKPDCELRGHFAGHFLSACALMYAGTGDERLRRKAAALVEGLAECQARFPSGYLSAYPEEFFDRVETSRPVWAPYYTLHKIFAGLLDTYALCGNQQALETARKFGDWAIARNARLNDDQMQKMLQTEHGGMNECLANLYALTGEEKYLKLAFRFNHEALLGPFSRGEDNLTGKHANTQFPKFIGAAREFELTGDATKRTAVTFFWNTVVKERSYVIGGNSDGEMFTPKEKFSTAFGPSTTETCNTYNMLKLTRHLFCWDPQVEYADYYERALYNHILASQNPENGMTCYYVPLRSGSSKTYCDAENSFWCCTGTGIESHAKYGDSIYFHTGDSTLYVNLFIASDLDWAARGLKVRQETSFPGLDTSRLEFTCKKPVKLEVRLRWPSWARGGYSVAVNGRKQKLAGAPGSWVALKRTWKTGDVVTLTLPSSLRLEGFADNPDRFAFLNGPLVLCAEVDPQKAFPAVVAEYREQAIEALTPGGHANTLVGAPAVFRAPDSPGGITLEPFYTMHGGRHYQVYFDRFSPVQWKEKEAEYEAELTRQRDLAARTVDSVSPGGEQNERDHALQGEHTASGDFGDRKWRHATDGGWFSWKLKVLPGQPQELCVTYWGSDAGNRVFDILVDDRKLASQTLESNKPGKFYDETYPIPQDLTQDHQTVTVRFQAHPGAWAGGVFGARVLLPEGTTPR